MLDLSIAAATTRCCCLVSDRDAMEIAGGGDKNEEGRKRSTAPLFILADSR